MQAATSPVEVAATPVPRPQQPQEPAAAPPPEAPAPVGGLSLVDVRRLWPEVVEAVKAKRRVTWIQLSQHAQVVGLDGRTLTLGFNNPGARESFVNGRSDLILQQVLIDLVGQEWKVDAIIDPSAQPGTEPPLHVTRPAVQPDAPRSGTTAEPRTEQQPTRPDHRPQPPVAESPPAGRPSRPADEDADRDDPDEEEQLNGPELLSQRLGAQIIEEIPHN
jgi:DNA polymerase-3 subunit gamma/tau